MGKSLGQAITVYLVNLTVATKKSTLIPKKLAGPNHEEDGAAQSLTSEGTDTAVLGLSPRGNLR